MNPRDALALCARGGAYSEKGDFDKALADFNQAIRLKNKNTRFYRARGYCYGKKGEHDKAIGDLTHAIQLDPKDAESYFDRGASYFLKNEINRAIADYSEAIKLNPEHAAAYYNRGYAHSHKGEGDQAIADYSEAIRLDPRSFNIYTDRANEYLKKSEYAKALTDYNRAIQFGPENPDLYNNRAWLLAACPRKEVRDGKRAIEGARKACDLTKWRDPGSLDVLAVAYAETGDFMEAIKCAKKALRLAKELPEEKRKIIQTHLALFEQGKPYRDEEIKNKK